MSFNPGIGSIRKANPTSNGFVVESITPVGAWKDIAVSGAFRVSDGSPIALPVTFDSANDDIGWIQNKVVDTSNSCYVVTAADVAAQTALPFGVKYVVDGKAYYAEKLVDVSSANYSILTSSHVESVDIDMSGGLSVGEKAIVVTDITNNGTSTVMIADLQSGAPNYFNIQSGRTALLRPGQSVAIASNEITINGTNSAGGALTGSLELRVVKYAGLMSAMELLPPIAVSFPVDSGTPGTPDLSKDNSAISLYNVTNPGGIYKAGDVMRIVLSNNVTGALLPGTYAARFINGDNVTVVI